MAQAVLDAFAASQLKSGCPYADLPAANVFVENARLVHMARSPIETEPFGWWTPPWERTGKCLD
jgi:hypothetical protein